MELVGVENYANIGFSPFAGRLDDPYLKFGGDNVSFARRRVICSILELLAAPRRRCDAQGDGDIIEPGALGGSLVVYLVDAKCHQAAFRVPIKNGLEEFRSHVAGTNIEVAIQTVEDFVRVT